MAQATTLNTFKYHLSLGKTKEIGGWEVNYERLPGKAQ